jgi:hypothetical protein
MGNFLIINLLCLFFCTQLQAQGCPHCPQGPKGPQGPKNPKVFVSLQNEMLQKKFIKIY